jgi:hypothetical protein
VELQIGGIKEKVTAALTAGPATGAFGPAHRRLQNFSGHKSRGFKTFETPETYAGGPFAAKPRDTPGVQAS